MVNHNTLPAETSKNNQRNRLMRFAAKTAIGLTLFGGAAEAVAAPASAEIGKKPNLIIKPAMRKLEDIKPSDKLRVLEGDTAYLVINPGATIYRKHGEAIRKERLAEPIEIIHGAYAEKDGKQVVSSMFVKDPISVPLYGQNREKISEFVYDDKYTGHLQPFESADITYSTQSVDFVHKGKAYLNGSPTDEGVVQRVNGRWAVPLAQAFGQ